MTIQIRTTQILEKIFGYGCFKWHLYKLLNSSFSEVLSDIILNFYYYYIKSCYSTKLYLFCEQVCLKTLFLAKLRLKKLN